MNDLLVKPFRCRLGLALVLMVAAAGLQAQDKPGYDPFAPAAAAGKAAPAGKPGAAAAKSAQPGVIASVEFVGADITSIFKMISDLTGWSIVLSPEVSKSPPKINIWIKNLTPDQVMDEVIRMAALVMERKGDTINVMSFDEYAQLYAVEKRVVELKNTEAKVVAEVLKEFVPKDVGKVVPDPASNKIVILSPPAAMPGLLRIVELLDVPSPYAKDVVEVVHLQHLDAGTMVSMLEEFIRKSESSSQKQTEAGKSLFQTADVEQPTLEAGQGWVLKMMAETKLNAVIFRGRRGDVDRAIALVKGLDVAPPVYVVSYSLQYTSAKEAYDTLENLIQEDQRSSGRSSRLTGPPRLRLAVSEQNNSIVVEGSKADHDRIKTMVENIDRPLPAGTGGVRVYRLQNATSSEVASVLQDIVKQKQQDRDKLAKQEAGSGAAPASAAPGTPGAPGASAASSAPALTADAVVRRTSLAAGDILPAQITDAAEINSVIIRASASEHEEFATVIKALDRPREQVMVEVTLVSVRRDNDFNLGVELSSANVDGRHVDVLGFSRYGVGAVNSTTGQIRLAPTAPFGLNLALFNASDFSLVLNALQSVADTRISSAPKILVLDNAVAQISRLNEEPYESTSQGENSTVTSFGGFVEAGTTLTVTPHIADENWLRLEYEVNLSSFGTRNSAQTAANLPPPRNTNTVSGTVRIPGDHMIVLGGLVNTRKDKSVDTIPIVGDIPLLGELFKNRTENETHETLYIFIRPIVMREPSFTDLLYLSESDIRRAHMFKQRGLHNPLKMFVPTAATAKE